MVWTTAEDVISRWVGSGVPTDSDLIDALIVDAETIILAEYPKIQDRIDAGTLSEDLVRLVTVRIVTRILRNPENLSFWQQSTGPFGQSRNFGGDKDIWLTGEEKTLLAPAGRGKAFNIDIAPNIVDPDPAHSSEYRAWEDIN